MSGKYRKGIAALYALLIIGGLALLIHYFISSPLKTSILDMIPETENTPATRAAYHTLSRSLESRLVILVAAKKPKSAIRAADDLCMRLTNAHTFFSDVTCRVDDTMKKKFFDTFFPARWSLLSPEIRQMAITDNQSALAQKTVQRLYALFSGGPSSLIEADPYFLFEDYFMSLPNLTGAFSPRDGHLVLEEKTRTWVLITATGKDGAFSGNGASEMVDTVDAAIRSATAKTPEAKILWTGMARYAAKAANGARREVSIIGTGSIIGVVCLLLLAFSSFRELVFGLIPIVAGIILAVVVTWSLFGELHLITLVFGASLVGVCIDYSFHYFAHNLATSTSPKNVLHEVFPGITLGMATSVIGYVALLIAPFPGFKQMAIFASAGLVGAWAAVVLWFPYLPFTQRKRPLPRLWFWTRRYTHMLHPGHLRWAILLCIPFAVAVPFVQANDDIRLLRGEFPTLEHEESQIARLMKTFDKSRFLVVQAVTDEALAQKEEHVLSELQPLIRSGAIGNAVAMAQLVPSLQVQKENRRFLRRFTNGNTAKSLFEHMGWEGTDIRRITRMIDQSKPLRAQDIATMPGFALLGKLRLGKVGDNRASVILFQNIRDESGIRAAIHNETGVTYVNKVQTVTSLFTRYRHLSALLVGAAYVAILIFLMVRYGVRRGMQIILPPLMTAILLLGGMSLLQVEVNLFTFFALIIVLAIGIDYTLFFAESRDTAPTVFAISLSGMTTILSFGLLALSQNPALRTFGVTVLVGIFLAMCLSPLSQKREFI